MRRVRRPVIVLAYGETGLVWLERVAKRYASFDSLHDMVQDNVIQFWAIGVEADGTEDDCIIRLPDAPAATDARGRLDVSRSARLQARHALDLRTPVLVVERWSLFSHGWEARSRLRQALSVARHVDCDPKKDTELDFQWVTFADAVRPAAPPDSKLVQRLRDSFVSESLHDKAFLIDRESANGDVIDHAVADRCYFDFSFGLLTSDLAFPPADIGDKQSRVLYSDIDVGEVIPFSIAVLNHPEIRLISAVAQELGRELLHGERSLELRQNVPSASLVHLLKREGEARSTRAFSLAHDRRLRADVAEELLAAALKLRDAESQLEDVSNARQRIALAYPRADSGPAHLSIALLSAALLDPIEVLSQWWAVPFTIAALAYGTLRWRSSRREEPPASEYDPKKARNAELASQWTKLLDDLERALRCWEMALLSPRVASAADQEWWVRSEEHPYEWDYSAPEGVDQPEVSLVGSSYRRLASILLSRSAAGADEALSMPDVIQVYATEFVSQRPKLTQTFLLNGLSAEASLSKGLRRMPLLLNAGRIARTMEVLWLSHPDFELSERLKELESAEVRRRFIALTSDDRSQSLRIVFGEPLAWSAIPSLSFLRV